MREEDLTAHLQAALDELLDPAALAAAAIGPVEFPAIAGASPGLFEDLGAVWGAVKSASFDPAKAFVGQFLSDLLSSLWAVLEGQLNTLGLFLYDRTRTALLWAVDEQDRFQFPETKSLTGLGAAYPWMMTGNLIYWAMRGIVAGVGRWLRDQVEGWARWIWDLAGTWFNWTINEVRAAGEWVGDRLVEARDYLWDLTGTWFGWTIAEVRAAGEWVGDRLVEARDYLWDLTGTWFNWTIAEVRAGATWVGDRLVEALGYAGRGFASMAEMIESVVRDATTWIWDNIGKPVTDELKKVPGYVIQGAQDALGAVGDLFKWIFTEAFEPFIEFLEKKLSIPGQLVRGQFDSLTAFVDELMDPPADVLKYPLMMVVYPLVALVSVLLGFSPALQPINEKWAQGTWSDIGGRALPAAEVLEAWRRDLITEGSAEQNLRFQGYSGDELIALKAMRERLPGPADLVRFGVREVYSPEIAERFGQYQDFPARFAEEMAKQGYTEETARQFWAAHWDLPSVTAGYEMLHRGVIDLPALQLLLRAQDVMPFWRDKLIDVAYNLPTRVDVRRLYKTGVYNRDQVLQVYRGLGYDPTVAEALTEFTTVAYSPDEATTLDDLTDLSVFNIRLGYRRHVIDRLTALEMIVDTGATEDLADYLLTLDDAQLARDPLTDAGIPVRELTVSNVTRAYREGIWERGRAQLELETLGMLEAEADLMLSLEDVALARSLRAAREDLIRGRYIAYDIGDDGARAQLREAGTPGRLAELLIAEWAVDRQAGTRRLSVSDVFKALDQGFMSEDQAVAYILRLGYNAEDATVIFNLREGG